MQKNHKSLDEIKQLIKQYRDEFEAEYQTAAQLIAMDREAVYDYCLRGILGKEVLCTINGEILPYNRISTLITKLINLKFAAMLDFTSYDYQPVLHHIILKDAAKNTSLAKIIEANYDTSKRIYRALPRNIEIIPQRA